jgi:3-methyladenine DNA glycosylase AlkD
LPKQPEIVDFVREALKAVEDPQRAISMAAYMKTDMPFYGVSSPARRPIARELKQTFPAGSGAEYRDNVRLLWALPHREEKYLAIDYALSFKKLITIEQIDLYRQMVVEGAWWDFVDVIASDLVGRVVLTDRAIMRPTLEEWIDHDDMWLRRTALLAQLRHKAATDRTLLFDFCRRRAHEKEFFIRKAIGWALREYARADPDAVRSFLSENEASLSGLSRREAAKHL